MIAYLEEDRKNNLPAGDWLYLVCVEPSKMPYLKIIENTLESMQDLVSGYIETFVLERTLTNATISLVFNENGNFEDLPNNRLLVCEGLKINLKGNILIIKTNANGVTCNLSEEEAERYINLFRTREINL